MQSSEEEERLSVEKAAVSNESQRYGLEALMKSFRLQRMHEMRIL